MTFKTLDWVRTVRNKNHEECKGMSIKEKIEYTKKMSKHFVTYSCEGSQGENAICSDVKAEFEGKNNK
jgi:hypothetical protein